MGKDPRFSGFNAMAMALAAAGLSSSLDLMAVSAAVVAMGRYKFVLLDDRGIRSWVRDIGDQRYVTISDDFPQKYRCDSLILKTIHADSFADISIEDRKLQSAWVPDGKAGWLSPEGEFWSCNFYGHSALATQVIQRSYMDLEAAGWCHVDCAAEKGRYTFRMLGRESYTGLTSAQEQWLAANGHDLDPYGDKARKQMPEVIKLGDYIIDKKADEAAFARIMAEATKRR